jgi:hypothetical protein
MNNYNNPFEYYIKGAISGMCGILLSHPLDIVKTHIQIGTINHFTPSIGNLYRGIKAPLIGVGIEKAIVFGTYNYCRQILSKYPFFRDTINLNGSSNPNGYNIALSGGISGFTASLVVTPYEQIKLLRINSYYSQYNVNIKSLIMLFKGVNATITREVPGFAIYFSIYEKLKNTSENIYNRQITYWQSFIFGGLSGVGAWVFIYPQDRIKTIIQSSEKDTKMGFINIGKDIYNKGGIKYFYNGFSWAVARAILLHSGTFCMMELLMTM